MDDGWYYAKDEKVVGPIPLENLELILSIVSDPYNLYVWKKGLADWTVAGAVKELSGLIQTPPPLPEKRSEIRSEIKPPPRNTPPSIVQRAPPAENNRKDLVGIGGWLILLAIGQIIGPLKFLVSILDYYSKLDSNLWKVFPIAFYSEAVLNLSALAIMSYTTYLFFAKSKYFPTFFVYEYAALILLYPIDIIIAGVMINPSSGQSIEKLIAQNPSEGGQWIALLVSAVVWISYIKKSKRVAYTFVSSMPHQKFE